MRFLKDSVKNRTYESDSDWKRINRRYHNQSGLTTPPFFAWNTDHNNVDGTTIKPWSIAKSDVSVPIVLTEGCMKALALQGAGVNAIGYVGIWNWGAKDDAGDLVAR